MYCKLWSGEFVSEVNTHVIGDVLISSRSVHESVLFLHTVDIDYFSVALEP